MPQITMNLSKELNRSRVERDAGESPFLQSNYILKRSYEEKMQVAMEHLSTQSGISLLDLQLSPACYAISNFNFFIEHFKNAYDAGATEFQITINLDAATREIVCTVKDNGGGFTSMFRVPDVAPVKPSEDAPLPEQEAYTKVKEHYDRQVARQGSKDPSGFADYRKIIDPGFDPEVGFSPSRIVSDKGINGMGYETTDSVAITGGRGLGLATTATLLNNITGMQGAIKIGDAASLARSPERQASSGSPIDDTTGAITVFSSPVYSAEVYEATSRYLAANPLRSSPHEKDYLQFVTNRIRPPVEEVVEEFEEFSFGASSSSLSHELGSPPPTPRAPVASGAGFTPPDNPAQAETLLSPSTPRSPSAASLGRLSIFGSKEKDKAADSKSPDPDSPASPKT